MIIAHTNDLHYRRGRKADQIDALFTEMASKKPDVITIAGDHTGDHPESVRLVFESARKHFPGPIVACLGNHDYWVHKKCQDQEFMVQEFEKNIQKAIIAAEENDIHLLEEHGVWSHPDHYGICIIGHGGWYFRGHHKSNDYDYLPISYEGKSINDWMNDRALSAICRQIESLTDNDWTRIAMTHMPVSHLDIGEYSHFGETLLGDLLAGAGCKKFLHGHMHQWEQGPNRFESGTDHLNLRYMLIGVV